MKRFLLLTVVMVFSSASAFAASGNLQVDTGDWDTPATWTGADYPGIGPGETATFIGGGVDDVSVDAGPGWTSANAPIIEVNGGDAVVDIDNGITFFVDDLLYTTNNSITFNNTGGGGATVVLNGLSNAGGVGTLSLGNNVTLAVIGDVNFNVATVDNGNGGTIQFGRPVDATSFTVTFSGKDLEVVDIDTGGGTMTIADDFSGHSTNVTIQNGSVMSVSGSAAIDFSSFGAYTGNAGAEITWASSAGTNTVTTGGVNVLTELINNKPSGELVIADAWVVGNAGSFDTRVGATTVFQATSDFTNTSMLNLGTIEFDAVTAPAAAIAITDAAKLDGGASKIICTMSAGNSVTFDTGLSVLNFTASGADTATVTGTLAATNVTVNSGATLSTVAATISNNVSLAGSSTFAATGNVAITGNLTINASAMTAVEDFTLTGDLDLDGTATAAASLTLGDAGADGDAVVTNGTLTIDAATNSGNFVVLGADTTTDINGDVLVNAGAGANTAFTVAGTVTVAQDFNVASGNIVTLSNTVTFDGGAAQTITGGSNIAPAVVISNTAGTVTISGATTFGAALSISDGVDVDADNTLNVTGLVTVGGGASGTLDVAGLATYSAGQTVDVGATATYAAGLTVSGAVTTVNGTLNVTSGTTTINNVLTIDDGGDADLDGDLDVSGGTAVNVGNGASGTLDVAGNTTVTGGAFDIDDGATANLQGTATFGTGAVTVGDTGAGGDSLTVGGLATFNAGATLTVSDGSLADLNGGAAFNAAVTVDDGGDLQVAGGTAAFAADVTIGGGASGTVNIDGNVTTAAVTNFIIDTGATATFAGDFSLAGVTNYTNNSTTTFDGTGTQTITSNAKDLNDVSVTNSSGSAVLFTGATTVEDCTTADGSNVDFDNTLAVDGLLTIGGGAACTLDVAMATTFADGGATDLSVAANATATFTGSVTLEDNTTIAANATVNLGASLTTTANAATFSNSGAIVSTGAASAFNISALTGAFTNTVGSGTITFSSGGAHTVTLQAGGTDFNTFVVSGAGTDVTITGGAISASGASTINIDNATGRLTFNHVADNPDVDLANYTVPTNAGTIEFDTGVAGVQNVDGASNLTGNLEVTGGGGQMVLFDALTTVANLTISDNTIAQVTGALTMTGNITLAAGELNPLAGATITGNVSLSGSASGTVLDVDGGVLSVSGNLTIAADATGDATVTVDGGNLTVGVGGGTGITSITADTNNASLTVGGGADADFNGNLTVSAGTTGGTTTFAFSAATSNVNYAGDVDIANGDTITLDGNQTFDGTGAQAVTAAAVITEPVIVTNTGGTISFAGATTLGSTLVTNTSTNLSFASDATVAGISTLAGTVAVTGDADFQAQVNANAGTALTVTGTAAFDILAIADTASVAVNGATATFDTGAVTVGGGASGSLTLSGATAATFNAGATLTVAVGATATLGSTSTFADSVTVNGTIDFGGNMDFNGANLNLVAGSTVTAGGDFDIVGLTGAFTNATTIAFDGTTQVVSLEATGTDFRSFSTAAGSTVRVTGGQMTAGAASTLTVGAAGVLEFDFITDGATDVDFANYTVTNASGIIEFDSGAGTIDVDNATNLRGTLRFVGGNTANVDTNLDMISTFTVDGATTVAISGNLATSAALSLDDGTVNVAGTIVIGGDLTVAGNATPATLNPDGASLTVNGDTSIDSTNNNSIVVVDGLADFNGSVTVTDGGSQSTLTVATTTNITGDAAISTADTLTLTGLTTFDGTAGVQTVTATTKLGNNVSVTNTAGTVTFTGATTIGGTFTTADSTTVVFDNTVTFSNTTTVGGGGAAATLQLDNTVTLAGAASVVVSALGVLDVNTAWTVGVFTITINATGSMNITGDLDLTGSTLTNNGALDFDGTAAGQTVTLGTDNLNTFAVSNTHANGVTIAGGDLAAGAASTLTVDLGALLILTVTGNTPDADFTNYTVTNNGTIRFDNTAGNMDINGAVNLGGALDFVGVPANTFDFDVLTSNNVDVDGTNLTVSAGDLSAASITVDGTNANASITVAAGNVMATGAVLIDATVNDAGLAVTGNADFDGSVTITDVAGASTFTVTGTTSFAGNVDIADGDTVTLTSTVTFEGTSIQTVDAGANLTANVVVAGAQLVSFTSATTTFGGNLTVNDGANASVTGIGAFDDDITVGNLSALSVTGTTTLNNDAAGIATVTADVGSTLTFTAAVTTAGAVDFDSSDNGGGAAAGPTITFSDDFTVAANLTDSNSAALDPSVTLAIAGDLSFADTAGLTLNLDASAVTFNGAAAQTISVAGVTTFNTASVTLGALTANQNVSITGFDEAVTSFVFDGITAGDGFTFDSSNYDLSISDSIDLNTSGAWTQSGVTAGVDGNVSFDSSAANWTIAGTLSLDGNVDINDAGNGNAVTATNGSTLTFVAAVTLTSGGFGAAEDGAATATVPTLTFSDNLTVAAAGEFLLGEGTFNFAGSAVNFSAAADVITRPTNGANDSEPVINLTGAAQTLSFHNAGSFFKVDSVAVSTQVTQDGKIKLFGNLDLSLSGQTTVWDGDDAGDAIDVGDSTFGNSTAAAESAYNIYVDESNALFGDVTIIRVDNGAQDAYTAANFTVNDANTNSTTTGTMAFNSLTVEGDNATDDAAGDDANAARCVVTDLTVTFNGVVTVEAGANDDNGASLTINDSTVTCNGDVNVNAGAAAANGSTFFSDPTTFMFESGTTFSVGAFASVTLEEVTFTTVANDDTYDVVVAFNATSFSMLESSMTTNGNLGGLDVEIGGTSLSVVRSTFSNYDATGVEIAGGSTLTALSENTFTDGQANGAHITIAAGGLGNGADLNADNNTFDNTITTSGSGLLVAAQNADSNMLLFRSGSSGFGVSGVTFTAAQAEAADGDDTDADDVRWIDTVDELVLSTSTSNPTEMSAGRGTGLSTLATAFLVDMVASGSTNTAITGFDVDFDITGVTAGAITTGSAGDIVLFNDEDADGEYDVGEEIDTDDGTAIPGTVSFTFTAQNISPGAAAQTWGVAFATDDTMRGTVALEMPLGAVTITSGGIVSGLPITESIDVLGTSATLAVASVASLNDGSNFSAKAGVERQVLGLEITNNGTQAATITGIDLQLRAEWRDSAVFDPNAAFDDIFAYVDGNATLTSDGDDEFTADGTNDELLGTLSTNSITIAAGSGAGGSGQVVAADADVTFGTRSLRIEAGDTKTVYFIIAVTSTTLDLSAAGVQQLDLGLSLQATNDINTDNANDLFTAINTSISGPLVEYRTSSSSGSSGCSISATSPTSRTGWWLLAASILAMLSIYRRRQSL